ncbi:hypothetical protein P691DRAFT_764960 [Macrolepiota fuliginosa MF-IS2]|uniref:Uncharacterized protein n=1 Tax=Macrolepiota fuliginosa MF-IS2 TaxID=1400762 RepID=A0A9P5X0T0_9AGAR|nr:hypothetical protein P691DRAFT_764960 [Macrolepiota fuliginosa MF-IS2]
MACSILWIAINAAVEAVLLGKNAYPIDSNLKLQHIEHLLSWPFATSDVPLPHRPQYINPKSSPRPTYPPLE